MDGEITSHEPISPFAQLLVVDQLYEKSPGCRAVLFCDGCEVAVLITNYSRLFW